MVQLRCFCSVHAFCKAKKPETERSDKVIDPWHCVCCLWSVHRACGCFRRVKPTMAAPSLRGLVGQAVREGLGEGALLSSRLASSSSASCSSSVLASSSGGAASGSTHSWGLSLLFRRGLGTSAPPSAGPAAGRESATRLFSSTLGHQVGAGRLGQAGGCKTWRSRR